MIAGTELVTDRTIANESHLRMFQIKGMSDSVFVSSAFPPYLNYFPVLYSEMQWQRLLQNCFYH